MLGKKGFTLIEIMVVMAIIGILAATAIVNTGRNDDRDVRLEADRLVTFLRDVQNKALSAEKVSGVTSKICGFGVHLIVARGNDINVYYVKTGGASPQDVKCDEVDNTFSGGTFLKNFRLGNGVKAESFPDIFFLSPHGEVYANGSKAADNFPVGITLTKNSTSLNNIVQIDRSGRIY